MGGGERVGGNRLERVATSANKGEGWRPSPFPEGTVGGAAVTRVNCKGLAAEPVVGCDRHPGYAELIAYTDNFRMHLMRQFKSTQDKLRQRGQAHRMLAPKTPE